MRHEGQQVFDKRKLRAALAEVGASQFMAAAVAGFSPSTVSRAINGALTPKDALRVRAKLEGVLRLPPGGLAPTESAPRPLPRVRLRTA